MFTRLVGLAVHNILHYKNNMLYKLRIVFGQNHLQVEILFNINFS